MPREEEWFHRIKPAQRDLIKRCGGIARSAELCGFSESQVGRWNNARDVEIMAMSAVIALESDCGQPLVTAVMANLSGRRLSDPSADSGCRNIMLRFSAAMGDFARLGNTLSDAFSDGTITPGEVAQMQRDASNVSQTLASLTQALANKAAFLEGGK